MRLSNDGTRIAFHPNAMYGICIRMEGPNVMIIWNGGYRLVPISDISTSWRSPTDSAGKGLPLKMKRPQLAALSGFQVIEVDFL